MNLIEVMSIWRVGVPRHFASGRGMPGCRQVACVENLRAHACSDLHETLGCAARAHDAQCLVPRAVLLLGLPASNSGVGFVTHWRRYRNQSSVVWISARLMPIRIGLRSNAIAMRKSVWRLEQVELLDIVGSIHNACHSTVNCGC